MYLCAEIQYRKAMKNPFVTNGYAGKEYFCDRIKETQIITEMLTNENNLALISPRRVGKTDLLYHVFAQPDIKEDYHCFIIDIYSTSSLTDFVNVMGKAVLDELRPKGRGVWEKFLTVVSSLRQEVSFDINGLPVWGMGLGTIQNPVVTLDEIFSYLNQADKPCLVAIDEFQQITKYTDGEKVEATLRTYVQKCTNAHFVFSGSHRHMMDKIFTSPSRPFYQAVTIINLQPIDYEKYLEFAKEKFALASKQLDDDVVKLLYTRFEAITSYMHRVLNVLYMQTPSEERCDVSRVDGAINYILELSSDSYESLLYQMPEKQRCIFLAIAQEGKAKAVTGGAFIHKHRLTSASSVSSALKGLLDKDFVTFDKGTYQVYDQFFVLWLRYKGLIKSPQ